LQNEIDNLSGSIADRYSNQSTYSVGAYVTYNSGLYRCTTAVTSPEEFDPTKWASERVPKSFTKTIVLSTGNWSNSQYDLTQSYPTASCDLQISICSNSTASQIEAWNNAAIVSNATSNILVATGETPTVDITVMITIFKK